MKNAFEAYENQPQTRPGGLKRLRPHKGMTCLIRLATPRFSVLFRLSLRRCSFHTRPIVVSHPEQREINIEWHDCVRLLKSMIMVLINFAAYLKQFC